MNADGELIRILKDMREKTGTEVLLSPEEGTVRFSLEFRGKTTDAYIAGGKEEFVPLIRYLVAEADGKEILPEKRESLKSVLLGEGGQWYAFRFMTRFNLKDGSCLAMDILPDRRIDEAYAHIERCVEGTADMAVKMDGNRVAVVVFSDGGRLGCDFAQFLSQSLYEELGVKASVGVGCEVKSFSQIASSYSQAVAAVRMSGIFHSIGEVHSYREYLLVQLLENLSENRLKEYADQFGIGNTDEIFGDADMVATAEAFLENSLNVSETSRCLFIHRNTLMYRLDKIERETGLDIRNFSDAVTFRVLSILYKLQKR